MGDLNIDTADKTKDTCNYLSDLCDTFSLTNIINGKTCFKAKKKVHLLMYCLQTSQPVFKRWEILKQVLAIITNSYSVFHSYFTHIPPKTIEYRNYKNFNESFSP